MSQVESLIRDLPDERLAEEIHARGIDPPVTSTDVRRVQASGAGPRTLQALSKLLAPSRLTVTVIPQVPEVAVSVASQTALTNAGGVAVLDGLPLGAHTVRAEKAPTYRRVEQQVVLVDGGSHLRVELRVADGRLTAIADKADAKIDIPGIGTLPLPIRDLAVPAGRHSVVVTAPLHRPFMSDIDVEPGEATVIRPALVLDPREMARYVEAHFVKLVADLRSAFDKGDSDRFRASARPLIDYATGRVFEIRLLHHHSSGFHGAKVGFDRTGLSYEPLAQCPNRPGLVPWSSVTSIEVGPQGRSGFLLRFGLSGRSQLNFAVVGSSIGQESETKSLSVGRVGLGTLKTTSSRVRSPLGAINTLQGVAWLASELRASNRQGP